MMRFKSLEGEGGNKLFGWEAQRRRQHDRGEQGMVSSGLLGLPWHEDF